MKKFIDGLAKALEWIGGFSILLMTVIVLLQVFMRRVVGQPLTWSEEFTRYMFIYITFIGGGYIICDSNSIPNWCSAENMREFAKAVERYRYIY